MLTGSDSDYEQLHPVMRSLQHRDDAELQLIALGRHMSPEFGQTYAQIENDGFVLAAKLDTLMSSRSACGGAKTLSLALAGLAETLARLDPEVLVVVGGSVEAFAGAMAAMCCRLPVAHLLGGEVLESKQHEPSWSHCITKMAHIHFVADDRCRQRVLQMGELGESVFLLGPNAAEVLLKVLDSRDAASLIRKSFQDRDCVPPIAPG